MMIVVIRKWGVSRAMTHQCVTRDDRSPEFAAVNATEEKVLFGCRILRVHHDNAPQLRHGFHLQDTCS